ncbi:hypothetical protein JR316_0000603 [Psilocybe cubensis]|uniref:Uncharacterized protein n=1 Tax=Psilocybe cubensis TaxID=181762 RepID=A0ACB8HFF3_PSICU|nr:hypothetical protein JR316_0000603 [Psilocybe cubensis]KAH9486538.1 hypothetical protein JR316_0000603 [Psilocybe cubensis]
MPPEPRLSPAWTPSSSAPLLTPVAKSFTMQLTDPSDVSSTTSKHKEDKLPHDASVFVGSLPSNMDQGDLTRLLMDHLSEHTQIKNIKVVRDSKGGVCAFVQCENAQSATSLIQTLHSSVPRPFLGRILRYEPARAFRSLIISYREPVQYMTSTGANMAFIRSEVKLELPTAMRIWKHRNSRFHNILYNVEAIQAAEASTSKASDATTEDDVFHLHPLKFDENSLRSLASYFGPLEKFSPLQVANANDIDPQMQIPFGSYPEQHRSPRLPSMDDLCWEIKWEHRDDCVSALMTLRRVPHLTVTWAHQPNTPGQGLGLSGHRHPFQSYSPHNNRHRPFVHQLPPHHAHANHFQQLTFSTGTIIGHPKTYLVGPMQSANDHDPEVMHESWADESDSTVTRNEINSCQPGESGHISSPVAEGLPPVGSVRETATGKDTQENTDKVEPKLPTQQDQSREPSTQDVNSFDQDGQDLFIPPTPALDSSTITPITPDSKFPTTPASSTKNYHYPAKGSDYKESCGSSKDNRQEREIDPTTLFVGGLEMFGPGAWNEEKVKAFFSRFGGLEYVKVVRPMNSCAAFAFVKFNNTEAPARAVLEEHNRVYEGRAMRVQLRDCNPPKNNWKYSRGRGGRPHQHNFGAPRRINYRPSFSSLERPSFPLSQDKYNFLEVGVGSKVQNLPPIHGSSQMVRPPGNDTSSTCNASESSSVDISSISRNSPPRENYREWYDDAESSVHTPEPSLGSSASTNAPAFSTSPSYGYPVPNGPYFSPPSWVHSYPPHVPYQVPYYTGYSMYPPTAVQPPQVLASPPGSDIGGPAAGLQNNWPPVGMYTPYIPYSTMPSRTQLAEQGQQQAHVPPQAPVVPTGFIQNEQGTLIAVYQPEALDQYLAGATPMPASGVVSTQQRWEYTGPQFVDPGITTSSSFAPQHNRPKSAGLHIPPLRTSVTPPREIDINVSSPLYRRQGPARRESQQTHGFNRPPNHQRPFHNGRPARAHMHFPANINVTDLGHASAQPTTSGDWNRWNNAR